MLAKSRYFLRNDLSNLLTLYHSIFSSHMLYGCQIWGKSDNNLVKKIQSLQNKAIRLISFADQTRSYEHTSPIYSDLNILKIGDIITLKNLLFIHDYFNNRLPESFAGYFTLTGDMHSHNLRNSSHGQLFVPVTDSVKYGRNSIKMKSILSWNHFAQQFPDENFLNYPQRKFRAFVSNKMFEKYNQ